jgi:hypothetical protein
MELMKNKFVFYDNRALIEDYFFYADHETEIDDWLWSNGSDRQGMVITFANEKVKTLFILRWS